MSSRTRIVSARQVHGRLPIPNESASEARLLAICSALAAEVSVLRERLDTHERLAAARNLFSPEDVDAFEADADVSAARDRIRQAQIARIFRAVKEDAEREAQSMQRSGGGD